MKGIARILGAVGWLMVIVGFGGPIFGLDGFNIFPGIVLLFISRLLGKQAKRQELELGPEQQQEEMEHPLNTERPRVAPPTPRRQPPRPATPLPPAEPVTSVEPETSERESIFESILLAGGELADEKDDAEPILDGLEDMEGDEPISSAEMIAQARRRWDRKP